MEQKKWEGVSRLNIWKKWEGVSRLSVEVCGDISHGEYSNNDRTAIRINICWHESNKDQPKSFLTITHLDIKEKGSHQTKVKQPV